MAKSFYSEKKIVVFSFLIFANFFCATFLFAATEKTWVIAADKFEINTSGEDADSVKSAIQKMIPERIVENLSSSSYRTISGDEELERNLYKLRNDRISLFLQLSSAIREKDSIFLNDYSEKKLKSVQKQQEKKVNEIREKIDANLAEQKKAEERAVRQTKLNDTLQEKSEGQKYIQMFKNLFLPEDLSLSSERVTVYERGDSNIYTPSEKAMEEGYKSRAFEKEIVSANINSVITGKILIIEDYISVTVEMFVYPGCKSMGVVTEIGSLNDVDFVCSSIARQITPWISASMPVSIKLNVQPEDALKSLRFSIDDIVYKDLQEEYIIDAGVHTLRFDAEGYKTAITSFSFAGDDIYNVEVVLQEQRTGSLFVRMKKPLIGTVYANGEIVQDIDEENRFAEIKINDTVILGQFISGEDGSGFFYVPEKLVKEDVYFKTNVKIFDKSEYIDKRRRMMYTSYSAFVVSLLGYIFTNSNQQNYYNAYLKDQTNIDIIKTTNKWIIATDVCLGLTIGTGVWFGFELFRYLKVADSVLPAKATKTKEIRETKNIPDETENISEETEEEEEEVWDSEAD